MSTKEQVLDLLNKSNGTFMSGQEIADSIYVTRAAVWKAIKALQNDGYNIEAVTNKGYRIKKRVDSIDALYIQKAVQKKWNKTKVLHFNEIDSTNDEAKRQAENVKNDLVIVADYQTKGRGRRGREFFSPKDSGLYFSVLLHSDNIHSVEGITAIAAVSLAKAIDNIVFDGKDISKIKWVNDIFYQDRKVAGILSEAYNCIEDEESSYIIIGFGINVFEPEDGFPASIKKTAGFLIDNSSAGMYLNKNSNIRSQLAAETLNNLLSYSNDKALSLKIYRDKSCLIGNYVKINSFSKKNNKGYAKVTGINSKYHLLIEYENGLKDELKSGEVSVIKY